MDGSCKEKDIVFRLERRRSSNKGSFLLSAHVYLITSIHKDHCNIPGIERLTWVDSY